MIYLDHTEYKDSSKKEILQHSRKPYDSIRWIKIQMVIIEDTRCDTTYHEMFVLDDEFNTLACFKGTTKDCLKQTEIIWPNIM